MSHFCGIVFVDAKSTTEAVTEVASILNPYDENLAVEPYIYKTKEDLIKDIKNRAEESKKYIEENAETTDPFKADHLIHLQNDLILWNNFESDLTCLEYAKEHYTLDEEGNELTTLNPNSKWDWWVVGGRWQGCILHAGDYDTDCAPKEALTNIDTPFCFVDLDGVWHERATMGMFGFTYDEKITWETEFREYLKSVPDSTYLVLIDFHI